MRPTAASRRRRRTLGNPARRTSVGSPRCSVALTAGEVGPNKAAARWLHVRHDRTAALPTDRDVPGPTWLRSPTSPVTTGTLTSCTPSTCDAGSLGARAMDLELTRFLQVAQTLTVHHGALAYLLGINALRASEAAAVRIEDYAETLRGHRVLHLVGKGNKPATMPITVPALRVLEACRGQRTNGRLLVRPISGNPSDRRDAYRMVSRVARVAGIPRHISPRSLPAARRHHQRPRCRRTTSRRPDPGPAHADPRTTEHYDRARGNLDRHGRATAKRDRAPSGSAAIRRLRAGAG